MRHQIVMTYPDGLEREWHVDSPMELGEIAGDSLAHIVQEAPPGSYVEAMYSSDMIRVRVTVLDELSDEEADNALAERLNSRWPT